MTHDLPDRCDLLRFASAAVDVHHHTRLADGEAVSRTELDDLHAHTVALFDLLDTATARTRPHTPAAGDHLHNARLRVWQVAEHLHDAYHAAPRADGRRPTREACALRLPDGAPDLTICQRRAVAAARLRRITTPADLHAPAPGLLRR
ncbi:DUF6238 family protein [Kitasatospora saccharophila]|uniref:DUF6238 family protein n=1 Tax=Kitasatospora saccharophila TaxID=407973 RepID=A0ABP5I3G5_9ACTN